MRHIYYNYEEWKKELRPCDIIFFTGKGIKATCLDIFQENHLNIKSSWVHVGIVCPKYFFEFKNKKDEETYIIESMLAGMSSIKEVENNEMENGLQIRNLKDVVEYELSNGASIACFRLKDSPFKFTVDEESELDKKDLIDYVYENKYRRRIEYFWKNHSLTSYNCNCGRSIGLGIPFLRSKKRRRLFCSETIVRFYQGLGFIDLEVDPEKVTPGELGKWCGDIIGDTPFNTEPYYLLRKPELNRQKSFKKRWWICGAICISNIILMMGSS